MKRCPRSRRGWPRTNVIGSSPRTTRTGMIEARDQSTRSSVGLDALLACDRSPHPHLLADELAQLFGAAQHQRDLLGVGELLGDALLAHAGRELGAEAAGDGLGRARG